MISSNKRFTFFTPTMGRTGSETALFHLLAKISDRYRITLVTRYKGALLDLLPSTIRRKILYKKPVKYNLSIKSYTLGKLYEKYYQKIIFAIKIFMYKKSVWYVNTITMPEVIEYAERHNIKLIVHVHEREDFFERLSPLDRVRLIQYPSMIIANSKVTAKVLSGYGRKNGVEICYPAIKVRDIIKDKLIYSDFRKKLGIADDMFLWVMSGSMDENKNPHLFIDIAFEVLKSWPNALFMWIGATENELLKNCKKRVIELGLEEKIIWIANIGADYYNYFNCADGFVLTSVKESFSLVTIEALLFKLPIVVQDCGGVREILQDDIGQIIKQRNSASLMAQAMVNYMSGKITFNTNEEKQRAEKFDVETMVAKWNQIINDFFNQQV